MDWRRTCRCREQNKSCYNNKRPTAVWQVEIISCFVKTDRNDGNCFDGSSQPSGLWDPA